MDRVPVQRRTALLLVAAGLLVMTVGVSSVRSAPSSGPHWAAVKSDGTIVASSPGVSAGPHTVIGRYDLTFPRDLSRCAVLATSGMVMDREQRPGSTSGLEIVVRGGFFAGLDRVSVIETRDGVPADFSFSIVAYC